MFFTNAFVNLSEDKTIAATGVVLFLFFRKSHDHPNISQMTIHNPCLSCLWPISFSDLLDKPLSGYREIPPFSNTLWGLWLIRNWLIPGAGDLCQGMNVRLDSALWSLETEAGWVRRSVSWILQILWRWHVSRWMWPVWTSCSLRFGSAVMGMMGMTFFKSPKYLPKRVL